MDFREVCTQLVNYVVVGGLAHSSCKGMESKYFRLCGLYTGFVEYFLGYVLFSVFVKTTAS